MSDLYIGLMSGTSVNAVDAVLARFAPAPMLLVRHEHPVPAGLRRQLLALNLPGRDDLDSVARLDNAVARLFADAVHALLDRSGHRPDQIRAVGSHGQTVRHAPVASAAAAATDVVDATAAVSPVNTDVDSDNGLPACAGETYTVQLGNPSLLTELTGITTVADFRRRDMAAGGQGAPLAPVFHAAFFPPTAGLQVVANVGGIANITLLPAGDALAARGPSGPAVIGFDTGPGNGLMDEWVERHCGRPFDAGGRWAGSGTVLPELLQRWLTDPYFSRPPPKSTGRDYFTLEQLAIPAAAAPADVQATLLAFTASTLAGAVKTHAPDATRLWVCGGGAHNDALLAALGQALTPLPVASSSAAGIDPDYLEALGFAWLAQQTLAGLPGNLPSVTGARGPRILGGIYPA